jgi:ribosome-associated translation inhibitor RaiA
MNIDIQTAHVRVQPDCRQMIDDWVARCRRVHPDVAGVEITLRHEGSRSPGDEATVQATARDRRVRGTGLAPTMSSALYEALDTVERELLVREAVSRRA